MTAPTTVSPFLRLPRELRDQIYTLTFLTAPYGWLCIQQDQQEILKFPDSWADIPFMEVQPLRSSALKHALPALCRVSKQIFLEATPIHLKSQTLVSPNAHGTSLLITWLAQFPNDQAFKAPQRIILKNITPADVPAYLDLLSRCPNITFLNLIFKIDNTYFPLRPRGVADLYNIPAIVDAYQLEKFADMETVKILIVGWNDDGGFRYVPHPIRTLMEKWFKGEFEKRGRGKEAVVKLPISSSGAKAWLMKSLGKL